MTRSTPGFDQRIADWLEADPNAAPSEVLPTVVAALASIPQARRGLVAPWRFPTMPAISRATGIAAVALVAIVGAGGITYFASGGPGPSSALHPTRTPAAAPTQVPATPTVSPTAAPALMEVQGDAASWTAAVPPGWSPMGWFMTPSQGPAGPTGIAVAATGAVNVPSNPCDGIGKVGEAETSADVVDDLQAREDLTVSAPIATTLGGHAGLYVDVELPADLSACGTDAYVIFAEPDGSGFYAQGPSNRLQVWVLDADGRPIVFFVESFAATPPADAAAAQEIVDSIAITP